MMENKRGKKIICIDIGGTAIKSGIMDENMNFLRTDVMDTPRGGAGIMDAVLERISEHSCESGGSVRLQRGDY